MYFLYNQLFDHACKFVIKKTNCLYVYIYIYIYIYIYNIIYMTVYIYIII